ncbi:hypothetical protein ACHWQZ_G006342 [Mnemiopsis leidyi]
MSRMVSQDIYQLWDKQTSPVLHPHHGTRIPIMLKRHIHGRISYHINGGLLYTDTSQFGSYVNSTKIDNGQNVSLFEGSEIKLGHHPEVWKIERMKVSVSNLSREDKRETVSAIRSLNIPYSGDWDKTCTTLIMSKILSTVKVIKAVSHCRIILKPEFIKDLSVAIREKAKISVQDKYLPEADESVKNAKFNPIPDRRTLFSPLQFVFTTEQDKKLSQDLVYDLGGSVVLLDSLYPNRRAIILSEDSIVMETKDRALSEYMRTTLVERGLVPTKHNDLILSLFYNDKTKLFKKIADSVSSQSVHIKVQDTQCFSQLTCSVQNSQTLGDNTCNLSNIEASVEPPRLDKTVFSLNKEEAKSTIKSSPKSNSYVAIVKQEMDTENDRINASNQKKLEISSASSVLKTKNDISFYEASALPPNLDKTIKTPLASPMYAKSEVTYVEPSVVPPRLDATIKSPVIYNETATTPTNSSEKITSPEVTNNNPFETPSTSHTRTGGLFSIPNRTSAGSDISLFDSSRSVSLFGSTTPSRVNSPTSFITGPKNVAASNSKRSRVWDDEESDDDEDVNPFAVSKTKSSFLANSLLSNNKKPDNLPIENASKKTKIDHFGEDKGNFQNRGFTNVVKSSSDVEISENSPGIVCESPTHSSQPQQLSGFSARSDNDPSVGKHETSSAVSQSVKRELHDKSESATKKFKVNGSPNFSVTTCEGSMSIPGTSSNVWIKRPDKKQELETTVASLVITDISADLIRVTNESRPQASVSAVDNKDVVNFKRFKKKGIIVRSMDVTLTDGQFRGNSTSIFDASQQSVDEEEGEEPSIFADKFASSRRTVF